MRARPALAVPEPADQVADAVRLDPEPALFQPADGQLVGLLLAGGSPDPVRTDPVADGVELVEPLEHPHVLIIHLRTCHVSQVPTEGLTLQTCYDIAYMR